MIRQIFKPRENPVEEPMRIAVLFSGGASAVPFMIDGKKYEVVGAISSKNNAHGINKLEKYGIPVVSNDIHDFYGDRPIKDMNIRKEYDRKTLSLIEDWEPNVIACSGYMYFLTSVFLNAFPNKVLNVHPADLSILDENGNRKYVGDNAVRDAMEAGERITRSTIHLMDEGEDHGPILYISDRLPVDGRTPEEQQELMKQKCDGPAYRKTLEMLSKGLYGIDEKNNVYLKKGNEYVLIYRGEDGKYFWDNL
ncbi:MAG: hypothetical protein J7K87_02115 [Candidatus Aenigmarchaeota archaeon]|nr:hypothetical protein [Candidatus Aenigmarchaeota archaeon]